jgi:DNA-binding beta-propeller fold protein YncE
MRKIRSLCYMVFCSIAIAHSQSPFTLLRTIPLHGVTGKFDHFAVDTANGRLFAAATGNHSVEVFDLKTDRIQQSIAGLGKPHGLVWEAETGSLYVADGALGELRLYKGSPLALAGTIKLSEDADDMVNDEAHHLLFVGHGGTDASHPARVAIVDTTRFVLVANLPVASHPEALDIDQARAQVFVNVAESNEVAVIGATSKTVEMHWKLADAQDNVPMAYDSQDRLLFIACRKPGVLIALDAATGKEVARQTTTAGADDLFFDSDLRRVYVIGGAGEVDSYQLEKNKSLLSLGKIVTTPGAKTGLFVQSQHTLYVGMPSLGDKPAEIRIYTAVGEETK